MENQTVARIIKEIQLRYNAPKNVPKADRAARLLLLADDLAKFDEAVLAKIWERFPSKYRYSKWPTISDIQKVADEVNFSSSAPVEKAQKVRRPEDPDYRFARGQLGTIEARTAAEEGYAAAFYDWCAQHKTAPNPDDIARIKASSRAIRAQAREKIDAGLTFATTLLTGLEGREAAVARMILDPQEAA